MNENQLSVRLHGNHIGILEQTPIGKMSFAYDSAAIHALSYSMPLGEKAYGAAPCEAYFGGLLPESENARKIIGKRYSVSQNNSFALLKAIGHDCAGAVSFHLMDEPVVDERQVPLSGNIVSDDELYAHIQSLPQKPLFMDFEGLRLSLAGVQNKAAVCLINNQIAMPGDNCPTTYILKPAAPGFESIVENEYLCLEIASQVGLNIPHREIRHLKDISFLLIERYDRCVQNNLVARIHQEDFCQALGILSTRKYQNEGGPSFKDCFELLKKTTQPAIDRNMLAKAMVFNFLIGNMDVHGKNFSLLHRDSDQCRLTPFYDLVCTRVYSSLSAKMAMKIGSRYEADEVLARHWEQQCELIGYSYPALKQLIYTQGEAIIKTLEMNREFYVDVTRNSKFVDHLSRFLDRHIGSSLKQVAV